MMYQGDQQPEVPPIVLEFRRLFLLRLRFGRPGSWRTRWITLLLQTLQYYGLHPGANGANRRGPFAAWSRAVIRRFTDICADPESHIDSEEDEAV